MKRFYAAAGALLLGTSALAWAAVDDKPMIEPTTTAEAKTGAGWDKTMLADKSAFVDKSGTTQDAKLALATDTGFEKSVSVDGDAKLAAMDSWSGPKLAAADMGDVKLASAASWSGDKFASAGSWTDAKLQTASATSWTDTDSKLEMAAVDKTAAGMGGPLEEVDATAASASVVQPSNADPAHDARGIAVISDVAYVPPGYNSIGGAVGGPVEAGDEESYPACTAERTDNCIQLYERGVRAQLASASDTSADLAKSADATGVGGPWEPVFTESDLAMNGDGDVDLAAGETAHSEMQMASVDSTIASHSDYQGVGGPVEAQSGYPACDPGPGDDRCIQLYEPGVTGAGN